MAAAVGRDALVHGAATSWAEPRGRGANDKAAGSSDTRTIVGAKRRARARADTREIDNQKNP
ncbi:MAG: hypothetical protein AMXMBFR66_23250 [Pseudomonadota bacterium]